MAYGIKETWTIQGWLQAATQNAVTAACNALDLAYAASYQTISLLANDGSVARSMLGRTLIGGVRVLGGVSYPESGLNTAEYSTYRSYLIRVEGTYPVNGLSPFTLLSWLEVLSFSGGGPRFVHLQPLVGLPQRQQVAAATPFKVSQRGEAVGLFTYPSPPPPLWVYDEHIDQRQIDLKTPKRSGDAIANVYNEWPVSWTYSFESAVPMFGAPSLWRG